jgi:sugar O-acyltransferase (sialic acid O-acetyltransferase NeuD family)
MSVIFGAGGVAREVAWLLCETDHLEKNNLIPTAFVTRDADWLSGMSLDNIPVLRQSEFFSSWASEATNAFIAIGLPSAKRRAVASINEHMICSFPNLIHPKAMMDRRTGKVTFGKGVIIYPHALITTEISVGDFVHINPSATVAHQARIGSFSTLCPGSIVSGNVSIGSGCFIGAGAVIKEGVRIADNCLIGAGAVVVKNITQPGTTWLGVPAREMQR